MRTIKFRAWNLVRKEMWTDFFVDTDGNICYEVLHDEDDFKTMFWPPKDKNILMQSTGLFDKNGVEIWEGDILKDNGVVEWSNDICNEYGCVGFSAVCGGNYSGYSSIKDEVIGNRYEHPELLK